MYDATSAWYGSSSTRRSKGGADGFRNMEGEDIARPRRAPVTRRRKKAPSASAGLRRIGLGEQRFDLAREVGLREARRRIKTDDALTVHESVSRSRRDAVAHHRLRVDGPGNGRKPRIVLGPEPLDLRRFPLGRGVLVVGSASVEARGREDAEPLRGILCVQPRELSGLGLAVAASRGPEEEQDGPAGEARKARARSTDLRSFLSFEAREVHVLPDARAQGGILRARELRLPVTEGGAAPVGREPKPPLDLDGRAERRQQGRFFGR